MPLTPGPPPQAMLLSDHIMNEEVKGGDTQQAHINYTNFLMQEVPT